MAYQQKELQGSLFTNQRKQQEKHPDWTGSILIGGVEYRLSGWNRATQGGQQYISIVAQVQQQNQYRQQGQYQQGGYQQQYQQMPQQMQQGFQQTGQFPNQPVNNPQYQQAPQPQYQQQPVQPQMQAPVQPQAPQSAPVLQKGGDGLPF